MSFEPSKQVDPFFENATPSVKVITAPDGTRQIVESRTIVQPNVVSYSGGPTLSTYGLVGQGATAYRTENQVGTSGVTFQNVVTQPAVVSTSTYGNQGFAASSSYQPVTTTRVVQGVTPVEGLYTTTTQTTQQPTVVRYETSSVQQPTTVTYTETRNVEQPVQVIQTTTRTVEQPVQVVKTVTTTTQQNPVSTGYQTSSINTYQQNTPLLQGEKYNDAGYNFYDGDVEDVHTEAPVSSGPANCGLLAGLLGLLAALGLVGLMAAIWARTGSGCFSSVALSHLIMACIAVVAAILGIYACIAARSAISKGQEVPHTLISIALLLALVFFAYFLASSVYMYMYRPFHYSDLSSQKCGGNAQWNKTFNAQRSFDSAWGEDRRILWWVALLSLVAAVGFLILAICLWSLTKFTVQTARIVLGAACLAGFLLACFGITYLLQARTLFNNNYAMRNFKFNYLTTLLVLLAIGGIILFLNAIWNIFKRRSGHFIFGTLLIIFVFIFVCFLGLMLRNFRQTQFDLLQNAGNGSCRDILSNFNSNCFSQFCPGGKYLAAGASCTKEFLAANWEGDGTLRYINPCCCNSFLSGLLCPIYYAAIMGLLFIMAVIIAIAANYYLSDTSEYLEFSDKKFGIFELLFVIGIILAIIGFGFYWGFRPSPQVCAQNPADPTINRDQFGNILSYKDPNFVPVDLNKVYNGTVPPSAYIQGAVRYTDPTVPVTLSQQTVDLGTANNLLTLNGNPAACGTANCGWRLGVLVVNGKIANQIPSNFAGTSSARSLFFNDNNSNDDFALLKGTQNDVQNAISQLRVNAIDITRPTQVYFNGQQVDLLSLNANGLQAGEVTPANLALDPNGNVFSPGLGYTVQDGGSNAPCLAANNCQSTLSCGNPNGGVSNCQAGFAFYSSNGLINVNVPLQAKNVNGNWVSYDGNSLTSSSYFVHQNTQYRLINPSINNGNLAFQIPKPLSGSVNMVLSLNDNSNQYLPYSRYVIIPADAPNPYQLEPAKLLTKSGVGCIGAADVNACFANQSTKLGTVRITAYDMEGQNKQAGIPIKLLSGIDGIRSLSTQNTDSNGVATFNNVAYDYYTVQFDGNADYLPSRALIALQDNNSANFTLNLHERGSGNTYLQQFVNNNNAADQDFNLNIASIKGAQCNVSPYNKYCGYASHVNDVENNQQGFENVRIHNFTESNYLAYLQNNVPSAASCGAYDPSQFTFYGQGLGRADARSLSFDWNNVRKAQAATSLYQTLYCFNGWGLNTIRHFQTNQDVFTSAAVCGQFWPPGSQWSLESLHAANSK